MYSTLIPSKYTTNFNQFQKEIEHFKNCGFVDNNWREKVLKNLKRLNMYKWDMLDYYKLVAKRNWVFSFF